MIVASTTARAGTFLVVGALEGIDQNGIASGWAQDLDAPSSPIFVHVYFDGPASAGGTFIAAVAANIPRTDPVAGPHGFRFSIPDRYRDGALHTLYVYGIDSGGVASENLLLSAVPQTFRLDSTVVHLDNGVIRFGLEPRCGGTLVELSVLGQNLVNNSDCTGRQVQAALYDGKAAYDSQEVWGWDPVQGGDIYNFGSPLLTMTTSQDSVYIATQPYEWYPDNKGGGPGRPVPSDVMIEQTASFVPGYPYAVRLHYRITHFGLDTHGYAVQEFPAVYVNRGYDHFVSYAGTAPWTSGVVSENMLSAQGQPALMHYVSEHWAAFVNDQGVGLTVYVPQQYPYAAGFQISGTTGEYGWGANYFRPHVPFAFGPGSVLEGDVYVIAGDYREARQTIAALHTTLNEPDILPSLGNLDMPLTGQQVSGTVSVSGWVFDDTQIAQVDVVIDGTPAGTARYGLSRPDIAIWYPHAPEQIGFSYDLDTRRYANGLHGLSVRATDTSGNVTVLSEPSIVVNNVDGTAPIVAIGSTSANKRTLNVAVQATDNFGVTRVELYVDGRLAGTDLTNPYSFALTLRSLTTGVHNLVAKAYDAAGNAGVSGPVQWVKR